MNAIGEQGTLKNATISIADPFNYAGHSRNQTMSLRTIDSSCDHVKTQVKSFVTARSISNNLGTIDIPGAQPKKFHQESANKPKTLNSNLDIERSQPRALHFSLEKTDNQLRTDDLPKCKPQVNRFESRRSTNPLLPSYNLPQVSTKPQTPPKFLRVTNNVADIEKAAPVHNRYGRKVVRDGLSVKDVPGASPKNQTYQRSQIFDSFLYDDVTKPKPRQERTIVNNPLVPSYKHVDENGKVFEIGPIDGSTSKKQPKAASKEAKDPNKCDDIAGAVSGTKGLGVWEGVYKRQNGPGEKHLRNDDIQGSMPGSYRRGMSTIRCSNPLERVYQLPGHSELEQKDPYSKTKKEIRQLELAKMRQGINVSALNAAASMIEKPTPFQTEKFSIAQSVRDGQMAATRQSGGESIRSPRELVSHTFEMGPKTTVNTSSTHQKFDKFLSK